MGGIKVLEGLLENEAFMKGIVVGIGLYQEKVITAHKRREPLKIGDNIFYLQDSKEILEEFLEKICK